MNAAEQADIVAIKDDRGLCLREARYQIQAIHPIAPPGESHRRIGDVTALAAHLQITDRA